MPENEPKGPQGPIETPQDDKNYFFELPGYENPMLEKRIFELSPKEKNGLTISSDSAPYLILDEKMGRYGFSFGLLVKIFSK